MKKITVTAKSNADAQLNPLLAPITSRLIVENLQGEGLNFNAPTSKPGNSTFEQANTNNPKNVSDETIIGVVKEAIGHNSYDVTIS